jgi:hypothetical protein
MSWLNSVERRFGFLAIPGLLRYVAVLSALTFILYKMDRSYLALIVLDPRAVVQGQVWRLVTYIFIPATTYFVPLPDWINAVFYVLFLWWMGDGLEHAWGAFKLTLFFLVGMIGATAAAFFFGAMFSNLMLVSSLFFAFAHFYLDRVIYFAYILPLKIKWVAWISAAFLFYYFVTGPNSFRMALVVAFTNYLLFFGPEIFRAARHRQEVSARRQRFETDAKRETESLHKCAVCGATELSDPNLDFRVSRDGEEYCVPHLPSAAV